MSRVVPTLIDKALTDFKAGPIQEELKRPEKKL